MARKVSIPVLLLSLLMLSGVMLWLTPARVQTTDPVLEIKRIDDNTMSYIATFNPKVGRREDIEYSHTFRLPNGGSTDIVVDEFKKSCDCLSAHIDKEVIRPGEYASISLRVKPRNLVSQKGSLLVNTNDNSRYFYRLQTRTYEPVMLEGGRDISLGMLAPGSEASVTRRLFLYSHGKSESVPELQWIPPDQEAQVHCNLTDLGVEPFEDGRLMRRVYAMRINVAAGEVVGLRSEKIFFSTKGREEDSFSSSVNWSVRSPISISPQRWVIRRSDDGFASTMVKSIHVKSSKGPCRVTHVRCSSPLLSVSDVPNNRSSAHALTIAFDTSGVSPHKNFLESVEISFDSRDQPFAVVESLKVIVID